MSEAPEVKKREANQLIYAGLLGLSAAAIIQLSDKADLSQAQLVEVCAFALAIPLLAVGFITQYARQSGFVSAWHDGVGIGGVIAAVVGLTALLFHLGIVPGTLFLGAGVLCFVIVRWK
jgi:hypothetical protein